MSTSLHYLNDPYLLWCAELGVRRSHTESYIYNSLPAGVQDWVPHLKYRNHVIVFLPFSNMPSASAASNLILVLKQVLWRWSLYHAINDMLAERPLLCLSARCCVLLSANILYIVLQYDCRTCTEWTIPQKNGQSMEVRHHLANSAVILSHKADWAASPAWYSLYNFVK